MVADQLSMQCASYATLIDTSEWDLIEYVQDQVVIYVVNNGMARPVQMVSVPAARRSPNTTVR